MQKDSCQVKRNQQNCMINEDGTWCKNEFLQKISDIQSLFLGMTG